MPTLYEKIGVPKNAKKDEIKRAYRRKAKEVHPDKKGGSTYEMAELNKCYKILMNDKLRLIYDKTGMEEIIVDNLISQASELVRATLISVINTYKKGVTKIDFILEIRNEIKSKKNELDEHIKNIEDALNTLKEVAEDITCEKSKKHPNVLMITIAEQIQLIEKEKLNLENKKEVVDVALEIMKQYKKKTPVNSFKETNPFSSMRGENYLGGGFFYR